MYHVHPRCKPPPSTHPVSLEETVERPSHFLHPPDNRPPYAVKTCGSAERCSRPHQFRTPVMDDPECTACLLPLPNAQEKTVTCACLAVPLVHEECIGHSAINAVLCPCLSERPSIGLLFDPCSNGVPAAGWDDGPVAESAVWLNPNPLSVIPEQMIEVREKPSIHQDAASASKTESLSVLDKAIQVTVPWSMAKWRNALKCGGSADDNILLSCQKYVLEKARAQPDSVFFNEMETARKLFYYS